MSTAKKLKPVAAGSKLLGVHFPDDDLCSNDGNVTPKQGKSNMAGSSQRQLSRSNDNLASLLRKKAVLSNIGTTKEGVGKDRTPVSFKPKLQTPRSNMHKSNSVQAIEIGDCLPSHISSKAQSVQNICRIPVPLSARTARGIAVMSDMKRTSSTQNMTNSSIPKRSTTNSMAYNAELLSNFKKEKKSLEQRISELTRISDERKAEVERLKIELSNARMSSTLTGVAAEEMQLIRSQNEILKEQLRENGISVEHFTDMEKLRLLEQIHGENNRSAAETNLGDRRASLHARSEASETVDLEQDIRLSYEDLTSIARRYAISSDHSLDRHSSLSVDRGLNAVSIADLKDRFLQMQETHYSTNEELQATLQELGDLQENLNEMTSENEKLAEDKAILFESLNSQTVKLEHARLQVEHLKALLIRDSEYEDRSENESQLVALVKSAEEEKEELLLKQTSFRSH